LCLHSIISSEGIPPSNEGITPEMRELGIGSTKNTIEV